MLTTDILGAVIVAGLLTGLLVLGAVVVGAWIGYRVKTQGDNLLRLATEADDTVGYVEDDIGEPERPGRDSMPIDFSQPLGMDTDDMIDNAASDIIASQNKRMLEQVLAMKAKSSVVDHDADRAA